MPVEYEVKSILMLTSLVLKNKSTTKSISIKANTNTQNTLIFFIILFFNNLYILPTKVRIIFEIMPLFPKIVVLLHTLTTCHYV